MNFLNALMARGALCLAGAFFAGAAWAWPNPIEIVVGFAEGGGTNFNLGEAMPYSGQTMRVLAHAGNKRSLLAPDVRTFKDLGIDLVFASERGVVAPKAPAGRD